MLNFYQRFLKHTAQDQAPLNTLLCDKTRRHRNQIIAWTKETQKVFDQCRDSLKRAAQLALHATNAPLNLVTDVSDYPMGADLQQQVSGKCNHLDSTSRNSPGLSASIVLMTENCLPFTKLSITLDSHSKQKSSPYLRIKNQSRLHSSTTVKVAHRDSSVTWILFHSSQLIFSTY
jgi:hypothetical protein